MEQHLDVKISALAERQHGVVSRRQLMSVGASEKQVRHRLEVHRLHRVHAGVYSVGHRLLRPNGRYLAAVLACGDGAVSSHMSAAALWGLRPSASARVDITVPRGGPPCRRGIVVHTTRSMPVSETAVCERVPCTSVSRTLLDLAAVVEPPALDRALERSVVLCLFDGIAMQAVLACARGRRGVGVLRGLLAKLEDDPPRTRNDFERRFLELVCRAGLPGPLVNEGVAGHEVDFHWPAHRLVVETDGRETHDTPYGFERDRRRDLDLELAGWSVLRFTWRQVTREPERVCAALRSRLAII